MNLNNIIKEADMVLVGIGEDLEEKFIHLGEADKKSTEFQRDIAKRSYLKENKDTPYDRAYQKLKILLEGKNYFIVTLCRDDKIYNAGLNSERIVAPLGSYNRLQCMDVCTSDIYAFSEYEETIKNNGIAYCPHCGKELVTNRMGVPRYSEEGYLSMWNLYMKWLQGTLNKRLCILELGVGLNYPSVIRWPFEKLCYINQKSTLIRVHEHLWQLSEEIGERSISIREKPLEFLRNKIV